MINFHKYGFLDVRKLNSYINEDTYWLHYYNPVWLFLWSDMYKPEIAFTNDFIFIRFYLDEIGYCYFPPINPKKNVYQGIKLMEQDAKERDIDFNLAPVTLEEFYRLKEYNIELFDNKSLGSYIYNISDLAFFEGDKYKKINKNIKIFIKSNPNVSFKKIVKEDINSILEFITKYTYNDNSIYYFKRLNMIKTALEHFYEFDLKGYILYEEKDELIEVIGFCFGSVFQNQVDLHEIMAKDLDSYYVLLSTFSKSCLQYAKYINFENDLGIKSLKEEKERLYPIRIENYFATFNI